MFTGLIEDLGRLRSIERAGEARHLWIDTQLPLDSLALGDSVAVNGCCLTVTAKDSHGFRADASHETVARTTMKEWAIGRRLHLERALPVTGRLGGHIVQGHVDGAGHLSRREERSSGLDLIFSVEAALQRHLVLKGSVAVDGVSLTLTSLTDSAFGVTLIPHTQGLTNLPLLRVGEPVNIETDILAKIVERLFLEHGHVDRAKLAELGFLR